MKRFALLLLFSCSLVRGQQAPGAGTKTQAERLAERLAATRTAVLDGITIMRQNCMLILDRTGGRKMSELTVAEWRDSHACLEIWTATRREELSQASLQDGAKK